MAEMKGLEFEIRGSSVSATRSIKSLEKSLQSIRSVAKKTSSQLSSFTKKLATAPIKKAASNLSEFAKKLSSVGNAFRRILFYRAIRTMIKEIGDAFKTGVNNMYAWSQGIGGTFAANMDRMATSMQYFKNSIGAAVAPLLNALAPALDVIIDKAVTVLNVINQLFARLTGATYWTKATKQVASYGDAVSDVGSAAKEAARYLAPFDELNVLPDNSSNSGSGSGGASDASGLFEEMVEFNQEIADFAQMVKDAWANNDWESVGTFIGDKLNELIENKIPWASLGEKFGKGINAIIGTEYWTLETVDFVNLGDKIAEFLNNAIENINFDIAGRLFVRKLTAMFDFIAGLIIGLDTKTIGQAVADYINGAITEAQDWIDETPFRDIGNKIGDLLTNALVNINVTLENTEFGKIGTSLADLINGALESTNWGEVGRFPVNIFTGLLDNVIAFLKELDWGLVTSSFSELLIGALTRFTEWIDEKDWESIGNDLYTKIKDAIEGIEWEELASTFADLVASSFYAVVELAVGFAKGAWDDLKAEWDNRMKEYDGNTLEVAISFYLDIQSAISNVEDWIDENFKGKVYDKLANLFGVDEDSPGWKLGTNFYEGFKDSLLYTLPGIGTGLKVYDTIVKPIFDELSDNKGHVIASIENWFIGIWNSFLDWVESKDFGIKLFGKTFKLNDYINFDDLKIDPVEIPVTAEITDTKDSVPKDKKKLTGYTALIEFTNSDSLDSELRGFGLTGGTLGVELQMYEPEWLSGLSLEVPGTIMFTQSQDNLTQADKTIDTTSRYSSATKDYLPTAESTIPTIADYRTANKNNLTDVDTSISTSAVFGKWSEQFSEKPWANVIGFFNSWNAPSGGGGGVFSNAWSYLKGYFNSWNAPSGGGGGVFSNAWSYLKGYFSSWNTPSGGGGGVFSNAWSYVKGYFNSWNTPSGGGGGVFASAWSYVKGYFTKNGGVFSNGSWSPITAYAGGGFPFGGQLFVAREAGPELVGTLGGHTAVMNNDQIVASVSAGVARAISNIQFHMNGYSQAIIDPSQIKTVADTLYSANIGSSTTTDISDANFDDQWMESMARKIASAINTESDGATGEQPIVVMLDGEVLYKTMVKQNRQNTRRTGINAMA